MIATHRPPGGSARGRPAAVCEDFSLSSADLREVTAFSLAAALEVLSIFESVRSEDVRPRLAIDAAQLVVDGAPRSRLQRLAAPAAHRAAKQAPSLAAYHAAMAAGDAAASMYLHPLARASQVGHILRASAHAACAWACATPTDPSAVDASLNRAVMRATPGLVAVLDRYPRVLKGGGSISECVSWLDTALRDLSLHGDHNTVE